MGKLQLLILILLVILPLDSIAENRQEVKKELLKGEKRLDTIIEKIEGKKREIKKTTLKEKGILRELGRIELALEKIRSEEARAKKSLSKLKKAIKNKEGSIKLLERKTKDKKEWLKKRIVAIHKFGQIGPVRVLFSSDSYMDLLKSYKFMKLIMKNDLSMIDGYRSDMAELKGKLLKLEEERKNVAALQKGLVANQNESKKTLNMKRRLLASVSRSKVLHEQALGELEESSLKLGKMIEKIKNSLVPKMNGRDGLSFSSMKGRLDFPVEGDVVTFFGKTKDPKFNTTIFQKGIDIAAPEGTEIKAVFKGKVLYAEWFKGYGKIIIIDHGEGYYTLSAHVSEFLKKVGEEVRMGETVARVGETGSLKGPYLYFEVRHQGKPVDPLDWLQISLNRIDKKAGLRRKR